MTSDYHIRKAKKRVKAKKGFYFHFASYVIVIGFLFVMNQITDPYNTWFIFPALSWGVGIAFHYLGVFGIPGIGTLSKDWEDKEIEKELQKMGHKQELLDLPEDPSKKERLEMDEHLELKEMRKNYDDSEFV